MSFYGDQVSLKTDRFKHGSVLYTNFVRSDGNTEQMLHANPYNIRVKWYPSGKEETISNDKVCLCIVLSANFIFIYFMYIVYVVYSIDYSLNEGIKACLFILRAFD